LMRFLIYFVFLLLMPMPLIPKLPKWWINPLSDFSAKKFCALLKLI